MGNRSDKPSDLIQTLKHVPPDFYPNINVAVKILLHIHRDHQIDLNRII